MGSIDPRWLGPETLAEATQVQREIAAAVEIGDRLGGVRMVAGADTSNKWRDSHGPIHAAIAPVKLAGDAAQREPESRSLFDIKADAESPLARGHVLLPAATATLIPPFPYVPGYLGFREAPSLLAAWERLAEKPDLLFVDGHGRAHPRRCGVASHIGVLLDVPAIGVAKSMLCGRIEGDVGPHPGERAPIVDRGEIVGMALRTSPRGAPVLVGIGHRVSLETAVAWVMRLSERRRLPLPIRLAHDAANAARRAYEASA